jgi:hypothetical protein
MKAKFLKWVCLVSLSGMLVGEVSAQDSEVEQLKKEMRARTKDRAVGK